MSRVRQAGTEPEVTLRKALWKVGVRYRTQYRVGGVKVDVAVPGKSLAIFVDGCFWHACPVHYTAPASNAAFWRAKIRVNRRRDRLNNARLRALGWNVLRVWECEIETDLGPIVKRVLRALGRQMPVALAIV